MSETGFEGWNDDSSSAIGEMVDGVTSLLDGNPDEAVDHFLDGSAAAVGWLDDHFTGGLVGDAVEAVEDWTGIDVRESVEDATQYVGEALGGFAYDVVEGAGEVIDDVTDFASDAYDAAGDAVDAVGDAAGDAWDAVTGIFD